MKIKITFELDLADTSYNIDTTKDIPECLQNLSSWLHILECYYLEQKLNYHCLPDSDVIKNHLIKHANDDIKLASQIFNNYNVDGVTELGEIFAFTHSEPGYKEELKIS